MKKEITRFLQEELSKMLKPKLLQLGFIPPELEKQYPGHIEWPRLNFDVRSKERKWKGKFAVWELEIKCGGCKWNVIKCEEILDWGWKPKIFMFHIFSPLTNNKKKNSEEEAEKLREKYGRKFVYYQFDINIPRERFERMVNAFEKNKYSAKQNYGQELRKELDKIVRESIAKL